MMLDIREHGGAFGGGDTSGVELTSAIAFNDFGEGLHDGMINEDMPLGNIRTGRITAGHRSRRDKRAILLESYEHDGNVGELTFSEAIQSSLGYTHEVTKQKVTYNRLIDEVNVETISSDNIYIYDQLSSPILLSNSDFIGYNKVINLETRETSNSFGIYTSGLSTVVEDEQNNIAYVVARTSLRTLDLSTKPCTQISEMGVTYGTQIVVRGLRGNQLYIVEGSALKRVDVNVNEKTDVMINSEIANATRYYLSKDESELYVMKSILRGFKVLVFDISTADKISESEYVSSSSLNIRGSIDINEYGDFISVAGNALLGNLEKGELYAETQGQYSPAILTIPIENKDNILTVISVGMGGGTMSDITGHLYECMLHPRNLVKKGRA